MVVFYVEPLALDNKIENKSKKGDLEVPFLFCAMRHFNY